MESHNYSAEFKSKIVLSILQGDNDFAVICSENHLDSELVRKWKQAFLQNAHRAFEADSGRKDVQRKKKELKQKSDHLTLERDFLQDCFRKAGEVVPKIPQKDAKD